MASVSIKGQEDTEIYVSEYGYICIRQHNQYEGDQLITIAPGYAGRIAAAIVSLQPQAQANFDSAPWEKNDPDEGSAKP